LERQQLRKKIEGDPEKPNCSAMNIKDFLSPTDVTIDVAVPNKRSCSLSWQAKPVRDFDCRQTKPLQNCLNAKNSAQPG
jgi:hypothetical protein